MREKDDKFILYRIYHFQDPIAFEELYRRYSPKILRYLVFKLPTQADAEDTLSEVFAKAWDYTRTTKVDKVGGLLTTIAKRLIANYYVSRSRKPLHSTDTEFFEESLVSDSGKEARMIQVSAEMTIIKKCITELPSKEYREVIVKRFLEKESISDIADHLGKTSNNTRVIVHRAIKKLQELIQEKNNGQYD
jgi:RNA polymerase sigma factor (sigma-70 family)